MEKDKANGNGTDAHLDLRGAEAKVNAKAKVHAIPVANVDITQGSAQIWFSPHRNS